LINQHTKIKYFNINIRDYYNKGIGFSIKRKQDRLEDFNKKVKLSVGCPKGGRPKNKKDINIDDKTDEKVVLSPSLNFLDNINKDETKRDKIIKQNKQNKNLNPVQKKEVNTYVNKKEKSYNNTTSGNNNHNTIQISKQNTDEDISHVIKRFNKNNNPALSLFIAKKYYDQGKYDKSYNYALITNNISKNMEASWIIFAKSLVKLHKKNKAIDTLKKYISHSDSHKAKILLDEITSGKFNAQ